ncbi:hypothetical protein [Lysobacter sp. HA35]
MSLLRLSLERVPLGRAPRACRPATNEERVHAFRAYQPVVFANQRFARSTHERYAAEACADSERSTDDLRSA